MIWKLLCRPDLLAPETWRNGERHFRTSTFVDVTSRGRVRPDSNNLGNRGRHAYAAQKDQIRKAKHRKGTVTLKEGFAATGQWNWRLNAQDAGR